MRFRALHPNPARAKVLFMMRRKFSDSRRFSVGSVLRGLTILLPFAAVLPCIAAEPAAAAVSAFNSYVNTVESRIAQQHRSQDGFLAPLASGRESEIRLRRGELIVEKLTPSTGAELPGAMLHHWRGSAFAAGATGADLERLMKDFNAYPQYFSPQVLQARVLAEQEDHFRGWIRVRQRHILTVVMDSTFEVTFGRLDARHGYSISHSTKISEIDSPGTSRERALSSNEEHGYLWRQNTYWSFEERDGGLYMQVESVSLTRSIPTGLGWVIGPFVESVPRESLQFTLRATREALRR
jgi:hypothetical protein